MKIKTEISKPHYHPGKDFDMVVTKKRDLSQTGQWVANERIEHNGKSYAIIMPPRDKELWEDRQQPHFHCTPEIALRLGKIHGEIINVDGIDIKLKISPNAVPRIHFDHIDAEELNIKDEYEI